MSKAIEDDLRREDVFVESEELAVVHEHLDHAMEWCENSLLDIHLYGGQGEGVVPFNSLCVTM